jgi:hypothetical protein
MSSRFFPHQKLTKVALFAIFVENFLSGRLFSYSVSFSVFHRHYVPQTKFGRHIVFAPFLIILIIILLLSFFLSFFLSSVISSVKSLSDTFLGDALIKLYETL